MFKSLKSVKTFRNSFLSFICHCPSRGVSVLGMDYGVMDNKMMEFFEKAKNTIKEIGFNAGSKRLEILKKILILKKTPSWN
jgi:hypothetical protein